MANRTKNDNTVRKLHFLERQPGKTNFIFRKVVTGVSKEHMSAQKDLSSNEEIKTEIGKLYSSYTIQYTKYTWAVQHI
jgi:hypothetical protein